MKIISVNYFSKVNGFYMYSEIIWKGVQALYCPPPKPQNLKSVSPPYPDPPCKCEVVIMNTSLH